MNISKPAEHIVLPFMRARTTDPKNPNGRRLKGFGWLPNRVKNHFIAMLGEFAGTFLFLFFAFSGTQIANLALMGAARGDETLLTYPNTSNLLYISLSFGFSLAVNAWTFFRISGGLFNPAVTVGMCLIGGVTWLRGLLAIVSQLAGAIASAAVVSALFPGPLAVRTTLNPGTSVTRGVFIEMFLTAQLVFTIFMLAAEKHKGTFLAPIGIGLSLFVAELGGVYFTGGSLNPARSFGPDVVLGTFDGYHWIYWVGPFLGSLVAVTFYKIVKVLEYETANPGQDFNEKENEKFNPDGEPGSADEVKRPDSGEGANGPHNRDGQQHSQQQGRQRSQQHDQQQHNQQHNQPYSQQHGQQYSQQRQYDRAGDLEAGHGSGHRPRTSDTYPAGARSGAGRPYFTMHDPDKGLVTIPT